jgi:hypothetical protein
MEEEDQVNNVNDADKQLMHIENRVRSEILSEYYPEMMRIKPIIQSGPSESRLRALRRSRTAYTEQDLNRIPIEHVLLYRLAPSQDIPFEHTLVVITDDTGEVNSIIESK